MKKYDDLKIIENFYMKGYNKRYLENTYAKLNKENKAFYDFAYQNSIIKRKTFQIANETLLLDFIDKVTPHSLYELMLIDSSINFKSTIFNYNELIQKKFFNELNIIIEKIFYIRAIENFNYATKNSISVTYNYDPYTYDRESIMSEKRFHFHIILHTNEEIKKVNDNITLYKNIDQNIMKIRLVDPTIILSTQIITDILKYYKLDENLIEFSIEDEINFFLPLGVKLVFDKKNHYPFKLMNKIHHIIIEKYYEIYNIIFNDKPAIWKRSKKKSMQYISEQINKLEYLEIKTKKMLIEYTSNIPEYKENDYENFKKDRKKAIQELYLAGPAYSCTYFLNKTIDGKQYNILNIYFKIFTDLGGAGMTSFGNASAIRIKRNFGEFTDREIFLRKSFQNYLVGDDVNESIWNA
ncbi:MAG: hypothetical protein NC213_03510 [Acetobacter sp.]|nr:hypothetical protein [Bacteroides sp.]MCM1340791.1 hypothetical protein [Acetobacter sp.]MCM1432652.1 hypothetical protein [Clostridiales bacterium]